MPEQFMDQLVQGSLAFVVCAREPYELTIQIHGVIAGVGIINDGLVKGGRMEISGGHRAYSFVCCGPCGRCELPQGYSFILSVI
jgi:hypothetical protein